MIGIEQDSDQLNTTTMSQQFSDFGKFAPLMREPFHKPVSDQTEKYRPELPEGFIFVKMSVKDFLIKGQILPIIQLKTIWLSTIE